MTKTQPSIIATTATPTWSFSHLQGVSLPAQMETATLDLSLATNERRIISLDFSQNLLDTPNFFAKITGKLAPDSQLTLEIFAVTPAKTTFALENQLELESGAQVQICEFYAGTGRSLVSHPLNIAGTGVHTNFYTGFALTQAPGKLYWHAHLTHHAPQAQSKLTCNGILSDGTSKNWHPTLDYLPGSRACFGREQETVLLLGDQLENHSAPLILAGEDDLDAAHAVTSGGISDDVLAYLASRGLDAATAKTFYAQSQLRQISAQFCDHILQTKLNKIIDQIKEKI